MKILLLIGRLSVTLDDLIFVTEGCQQPKLMLSITQENGRGPHAFFNRPRIWIYNHTGRLGVTTLRRRIVYYKDKTLETGPVFSVPRPVTLYSTPFCALLSNT